MTKWTADDIPPLDGKTVVVTGANSGLGYYATKFFAKKGAHVVMACRSLERAESAQEEIQDELSGSSIDVRRLDLASLSSVESFAEDYRDEYDRLDVLCNNAGVMAIPRSETEDGFETQFGVNHLGHFVLTGYLIDTMVETEGESRVVTTSSEMHNRGEIDFEDLHGEESYDKWDAYAQSKLANLLFAYELQRKLEDTEEDVISVGVHPGYAATNLQYVGPEMSGSVVRKFAMKVANAIVAQSAERGALPILYGATADDVDGGEYVGPGGLFRMRGYPEVQDSSKASKNRTTAEKLWRVSEELTGMSYDL